MSRSHPSISSILKQLADDFASVVPKVDSQAEHERWKPGIGPFEEEKQLEMLVEATERSTTPYLAAEQAYPTEGQRCDLVIELEDMRVPVEAKLLRFRYDNGNIDPNSYAQIFTPFPERSSSSLLTDAAKLYRSNFEVHGGLLGLYYEKKDEEYDQLTAENVAEKFSMDVNYWHGFEARTTNIARFSG